MPATILVTSPHAAPSTFWIEAPVVRVGSEAGSELRLPHVEPHALTLQYRQGEYRVFNRTGRPLGIGGKLLGPQQSAVWSAGQRLQLAEGTQLELRLEGNAAPQPRRQLPSGVEPLERSAAPGAGGKWKNDLLQYAIIAACVVGMFVVYGSGPPPRDESAEFARLITHWQQSPAAADSPLAALPQTLQMARRQELRREYADALREYQQARTLLQQDQPAPPAAAATALSRETSEFISRRIERLAPIAGS